MHYNNLDDDATLADGGSDDLDRVDLHRFILFANHEFNDWLRLSSEIEIEHSVAGDGEPGEVELEQVWIEADLNQNHRVRAGLDILPIGLINVTHEPNTFYGVERNRIETEFIPSAWWEAGVALNGVVVPGLSYDLVLHSRLVIPTIGGSAFRPRSGRLRSTGILGLELALAGQYQADYTGTADNLDGSAYLIETHLDYRHATGLALRALYARWVLGDDDAQGLDPSLRDADTL